MYKNFSLNSSNVRDGGYYDHDRLSMEMFLSGNVVKLLFAGSEHFGYVISKYIRAIFILTSHRSFYWHSGHLYQEGYILQQI